MRLLVCCLITIAVGMIGYLTFSQTALANPVASFDDIVYWVGEGENESALVIDWDGESQEDESLVWGHRWDGNATGEEMLLSILHADTRFFAKMSAGGGMGAALYGLGYDLNDDDSFSLSDGTAFNADGIAISGPPDDPNPAATALDPDDLYTEGWFTGYWRHGVSIGNPFDGGEWTGGPGMTGRLLTDGSWDSWTFTSTFSSTAFAENPIAAEQPPSLAADFEPDGDVDGDDLAIWQRNFGLMNASHAQGDVDLDGNINGHDFLLWQHEFGEALSDNSAGATPPQISIPEPSGQVLTIVFILLFCVLPKFVGCVQRSCST